MAHQRPSPDFLLCPHVLPLELMQVHCGSWRWTCGLLACQCCRAAWLPWLTVLLHPLSKHLSGHHPHSRLFDKVGGCFTKVTLSLSADVPQTVVCTAGWQGRPKQMHSLSIDWWLWLKVPIVPLEKPQIVLVFYSYVKLMEHAFNIAQYCYWTIAKPAEQHPLRPYLSIPAQ